MSATIKARTARVAHRCEYSPCRGEKSIAPGHRYLAITTYPGDVNNDGDSPISHAECIACAGEKDETAPLLVAGACGSFCHGDIPCALPFGHEGDRHSCRVDARDLRMTVSAPNSRAVPDGE